MAQTSILSCSSRPKLRRASFGISDNLHLHRSLARAVILTKENALPAAENKTATLNKNHLARSRKNRFGMRIRIPFRVAILALVRNEAVHDSFNVGSNVRVGMLVDRNASSRMRNVNVTNSVLDAGFRDYGLNPPRYVKKLRAPVRADA